MRFEVKAFNRLSPEELYDILRLRQEVFIVEQDCAYLDADGKDEESLHVLLMDDSESLIGYARVLPEDLAYAGYTAIGRVIVAKTHRRKGLGEELLKVAIVECRKMSRAPIKLSAQTYALDLYSRVGFKAVGPTYLEDGIPHQAMVLA